MIRSLCSRSAAAVLVGALLAVLARRPRRVFSRSELMAEVFPDAEDDGVVDTYVHYLRRKLGRGTVRTVRGLGYQLGSRARA